MDEALAYLLQLRLRVRGNRGATRLVDRALQMIARASDPAADGATVQALEVEFRALGDDLARLYGAPKAVVPH